MADMPESSETFPEGSRVRAKGRGASGGPGGGGATPRTMADITRLFMAGANPVPPSGHRPQRLPPRESAGAGQAKTVVHENEAGGVAVKAVAAAKAAGVEASSAARNRVEATAGAGALPRAQLAIVGGMSEAVEAARLLAGQHGVPVGVVGCEGETLKILLTEPARRASFTGSVFASPEAAVDVQVARALFALGQTVGHWVVALPGDEEVAGSFQETLGEWLVFSGVDNEGVINCYRKLKSVCGATERKDRTVRLMLKTMDRGEAARVHARLNSVAEGFLHQPLVLVSPTQPATASVRTVVSFELDDAEAGQGAWMSVLDFLEELSGGRAQAGEEGPAREEKVEVGSVLEEEERAALSAALEAPVRAERVVAQAVEEAVEQTIEVPAAKVEREPAGPVKSEPAKVAKSEPVTREVAKAVAAVETARASVAGAVKGEKRPSLEVVETDGLPLTRAAMAEVVRGTMGALATDAVALEARPPMDEAATLAVDAAGRLHVWTVAEESNPAGWAGLWQWAMDHRQLIALTRRELKMDVAAGVMVHVALPPGMAGMRGSGPEYVRWYRVCAVRWGTRDGVTLVPLQ